MELSALEKGIELHNELQQFKDLRDKITKDKCWMAFAVSKGQGQGIEIPRRLKHRLLSCIEESINEIKAEIDSI